MATSYGWPVPMTLNREAGYSRDQINQLRLIQRLLDAGSRPTQTVEISESELQRLVIAVAPAVETTHWSIFARKSIELLKSRDIDGLEAYLHDTLDAFGLGIFVRDHAAPMVVAVGDAWAKGEIEVHQEHLISSLLIQMLQAHVRTKGNDRTTAKRVLLATPPEELHTLGLQMVQALFSDKGCSPMMLGASVPLNEIPRAAEKCRSSIVGLSFSFSFPARKVLPVLKDLRAKIDPAIEIWAGDSGMGSIPKFSMEGVRAFRNLDIPFAMLGV